MLGKVIRIISIAATAVLIAGHAQVRADNRIKVKWFVGFATGTVKEQFDAQQAIVDQFNASQNEIALELQVATGGGGMILDAFSIMLGADDLPDVVGPIGVVDAVTLPGDWTDLSPLALRVDQDLSQIPDRLLKFYTGPDGLVGIPFGLYPPILYYSPELFNESDLAYPPTTAGEKYTLDGKAVDWDYATFNEIAKRLTFDKNGNDATNANFDLDHIEQFGFSHEWSAIRFDFSSGLVTELFDQTGHLHIPEAWRAEARSLWASRKTGTSPSGTYLASAMLIPNPFASGRVAMERLSLSYACCLSASHPHWDIAVPPSHLGSTPLAMDSLTFRIPKASKHVLSAFKVIQYLTGPAALDLLLTYGVYPARVDLRTSFVQALRTKYPKVTGWSALTVGPDAVYSDFNAGKLNMEVLYNLLYLDRGQQLNVDEELDKFAAGQAAETPPP